MRSHGLCFRCACASVRLGLCLVLSTGLILPAALASSRPAAHADRKAFEHSWRFYQGRVEAGVDLQELEDILVRIQRKYRAAGLDLSAAARELSRVRALKDAVESGATPRP
jgi:hypothetical protein